jgi:hypothetical protein
MDNKYDKPLPETGIRAFIPSDKVYAFKGMTPEKGQFVISNLQINPKEFFAYVKEYLNEYGAEQEHMFLNIKLSKGGKFYITVDEYKAEGRGSNSQQAQQPAKSSLPWEN